MINWDMIHVMCAAVLAAAALVSLIVWRKYNE